MSNGKDEGKKFSGQFPFMGSTPFGMQQKSPGTATPFGMQQKSPANVTPFGMQPKVPPAATPSWQISKLKKTMDFAAVDDVLPRDSSDAYQIEKNEIEDDSRFRSSDDGLKQQEDMENAEIEGQEKFDDGKEIEDDENWESEEDYFQELAERNALLESALKERIANPFPPVYNQIMKLCDALTNKEKMLKPPVYYVDEIAKYIEKKIATFSNLPKVDNHNITKSNQLMIDGLNLLTEANNCLRNYLNDEAPYQLDMSRRFTAQANEFFTEGKNLLLSVKIEDKKE